MAAVDTVELQVGSARWMRVCHLLVSLLGLLAIATSPISMGWLVTAAGALCLAHVLTAWRMGKVAGPGRLVLQGDGNATLLGGEDSFHARYRGAGWASRWLCVLPLDTLEGGRPLHCIVCRSQNSRDAWRRLLIRLRADGAPGQDRGRGWT